MSDVGQPCHAQPSKGVREGHRLAGEIMSASIAEVEEMARKCRVEIVKMVYRAQAGHPGGSLSEIDLLAALYATRMRVRPDEPKWSDRDLSLIHI